MTPLEARLVSDLEAERTALRARLRVVAEKIKQIKRRERGRALYAARKTNKC